MNLKNEFLFITVIRGCKIQCLILENEIEKYNPKIVPIDDYDVSDDATDYHGSQDP